MTGEVLTLTISKLGITLAGFVSLVAALRHHENKWVPQDVAGLKFMLEHTLTAVLLGVLPSALHLLFHDESLVWRIVSLLLFSFFLAELLLQAYRIYVYSKKGSPPRRFKTFLFGWILPTLMFLIIQILNVIIWGTSAPYAFGLIWLLIAAGIQFMHFMHFFGQSIEKK